MRRVTCLLLLAAAGTAVVGGCASTPEEDPVQTKLNELDARVTKLERVLANKSLVELAQNQESQQADVRQMRGQIDQIEHDNAALRKQQHDMYDDLDSRMKALSGGTGAGSGPGGSAGGAAAGSGNDVAGSGGGATQSSSGSGGGASSTEQAVYNQSFDALKAGSYSTAITGFRDFLTNYPQSPLAENAQYWLGEAYYVNHDYDSAGEAFRAVLRKYPDARKAPDALLKIGYTQFEQKQYGAARNTLNSVTQKYPGTDAAKLAADKLKRIPAQ